MTARAFLVRGLLCGLLAGFATFVTAFYVGEPHVQAAVDLEESGSAAAPAEAGAPAEADGHTDGEEAGHTHDEGGMVVSRHNQRTWGLLTGSFGVGTALGGLVALASAGVVGRMGSLRPSQSTALVALLGWVSVTFVPFLKYPATPPSVGDADTIGTRTAEYFAFTAISVIAGVVAVVAARRLHTQVGTYAAVVGGVAGYLLVMVVVGQVMPTVNELGDFPADTLWYFRRASLLTTATTWAVIGILLTGAVGRLHGQDRRAVERRQLAASL